jgi:putative PIG3 family NAD(P)H quinone oxidoreductase
MRAVLITGPGGPEVLEVRESPRPAAPGGNQVLVRVRAAGVNRADILQRMGHYPPPPGHPTDIPGMEFAGEVASVGESVRRWSPGQRVYGLTGGGAYAEFVVVPEDHLAAVPSPLDWEAAAAVPEAFITAHDALFTQADLRIGESVLIHAAGSGVGLAAVQLARAAGAMVIGTSRTPDKLSRARALGLDVAVVPGDDLGDFVARVLKVTGAEGASVILDLVGAGYMEANLKAAAPKGRLVLVSTASGAKAGINLGTVMSKRLRIFGTVLRARSNEEKATATRLFAEQVGPLLARGIVRPIIDSIFTLDQVAEAHRRVESNETFGKVVLSV